MENYTKETDQYIRLLFSYNNPIYYSVLFVILLFILVYFIFKYVIYPRDKKHLFETQALELKNARLMALFAELDPNPVIRTDLEGKIIYTNDAAKLLAPINGLIGKHIGGFLTKINFSIIDCIKKDESRNLFQIINTKSYSILFRGISSLDIAQIYFRDITDQLESEKELRSLSNKLQNTIEEERQRMSHELHDGIGQELLLLKLNIIKNYKDIFESADKEEIFAETINSLQKIIVELKMIIFNLKPHILEEMGLDTALVSLINKISDGSYIKGNLNIIGVKERLSNILEITIYRVIQEALNNIIKHSKAKEFSVQLINRDNKIKILISDDGIGIKENEKQFGFGLINMRERIEALNGSFKIDPSLEEGTLLIIEIPQEQK